MKNQTISLKLSVLDSSSSGAAVYVESQGASTNGSGHFAIQIGGGTAILGTFDSVGWANGRNKYLKTELSQNGTWVNLGTSQLVSVPFALHAGSAEISKHSLEFLDSSGNAYQIKTVNGQPTLVAAPGSSSASNPGPFACGQSVTYAGESYPTVQIGTQCWFQKNLNVGTMVNPSIAVDSQRNNGIIEKYCYDDNPISCIRFGGLYQWSEALQYQVNNLNSNQKVQGICPDGWHIPCDSDFIYLTNYCGGINNAGYILKSSNTWLYNGNGNNNNYFSAISSGIRYPNEIYQYAGSLQFFWSTDLNNTRILNAANSDFASVFYSSDYGFSVRCLKD